MKRLFKILLISMFINCYNIYSQEINPVDKWKEYIEELAEERDENDQSVEVLYDELSYISEHPFDLNKITAEQLKQLPFLSDLQIGNILNYLKKNGEFVSIYELKNIEALDMLTIELFLPFVYVGEYEHTKRSFTMKNLLKYGDNELMTRFNKCLNKKAGYANIPDSILEKSPNKKYRGESFYNSLRYSYVFEDRLQFGFIAEKDAGEPFFDDYHKGYDYYSAHVILKNIGKISCLALGDYKMSFGQGLVVSNDFTPSRSSVLSQVERRNNGFRRHYSTNETDFFRGGASTISLKNVNISAFYSYRKIDATIDSFYISSFKTDGLHRTESEIDKKSNATIQTFGGNIRYATPRLVFGVTAINYSFGNLSVNPKLNLYNKFYFRGKSNTNASVDYAWRHRRITFFGETAISENGAMATLNAIQLTAASSLKALVLYRYYDRRYQAYFGNAFSQNSTVQNEEGLYMSLQWAPIAYWQFSGYADFFRFPWLKYGVDAPSSGKEYMLQADFSKIKNTEISFRYKFRNRENNVTQNNETTLQPSDQHRLRLQITVKPSETIAFKTSAEGNIYDEIVSPITYGWMISQSAGWKNTKFPLQADIFVAYFNTDDYNTRIYAHEKNMLYSFSMPSFYGEGIHLSTVMGYNFTRKLSVSVKAAITKYYDRDIIGTNLEEIEGDVKTDLNVQIRWRF